MASDPPELWALTVKAEGSQGTDFVKHRNITQRERKRKCNANATTAMKTRSQRRWEHHHASAKRGGELTGNDEMGKEGR